MIKDCWGYGTIPLKNGNDNVLYDRDLREGEGRYPFSFGRVAEHGAGTVTNGNSCRRRRAATAEEKDKARRPTPVRKLGRWGRLGRLGKWRR